MPRKKQIIGKDGQLKTVVRADRSRSDRIEQHMHGRSDHIRLDDSGMKYVIYAFVIVLVLGFLLLFLWQALASHKVRFRSISWIGSPPSAEA